MIEAAGKTIEPRVTCDIFCHVIDNFGDAGVCWRLAGGLSEEEGFRVTLYIDDAVTLSKNKLSKKIVQMFKNML